MVNGPETWHQTGASLFNELRTWLVLIVPLLIGIVGFLILVLPRAYALLARMNAGSPRGNCWQITGTLLRVVFADFKGFVALDEKFIRRVRMLVEYEIFYPKPQFVWPLNDDNEDYKDVSNKKAAKKAHDKACREWSEKVKAFLSSKSKLIRVPSAKDVNEKFSQVKRYFDTVKTLDLREDREKFLCQIEVGLGFVAPLHLLSGLLVRFNQKWPHIIESFERDSRDFETLNLDSDSRDVRQIQMFIYNCWLLWGPSIPICAETCNNWKSEYLALQYGYGDENNSIELVGKSSVMQGHFQKLLKGRSLSQGIALAARITGCLQYSSLKPHDDMLPRAVRNSWRGTQDTRPTLFVSEISETPDGEARTKDRTSVEVPRNSKESPYYSAYLWVIFVILRYDGSKWSPAHPLVDDGDVMTSGEPWKDIIPFFEHGNIADRETYKFLKEQLAEKAIAGLARIVRKWGDEPFPLKFAYACAIDDTGCGHGLAFPVERDESLRTLMETLLSRGSPVLGGKEHTRLLEEEIVKFDRYHINDHPYSTCSLPAQIALHYQRMGEAHAIKKIHESEGAARSRR